jgi:hypothetical protein
MQQISLTLGVTTAAASLTVTMAISGHDGPMLADFSAAFLVVSAIALLAAPLALVMPREAASELSGHRHRG